MKEYPIYIDQSYKQLRKLIKKLNPDKVMIVVDENTKEHCLPQFIKQTQIENTAIILMSSGEESKNINSIQLLWKCMFDNGLTRKSLVINLGGGVIGDMGGFAAATYMRGIAFIQAPTTLLSMVDASIGGKLGIDFHQIKNSIGLFKEPNAVWVDSSFLHTLPHDELNSGMAEVIKHSLIADPDLWKKLRKNKEISLPELIKRNIQIKKEIVQNDSYEAGLRKILNYGHTVGHAIEAVMLDSKTPILHGYAVALGMIVENVISNKMGILTAKHRLKINTFLKAHYPCHPIRMDKNQWSSMMDLMKQDKKNDFDRIKMSLISSPGSCSIDVTVTEELIEEALLESEIVVRVDESAKVFIDYVEE